MNLNSTLISLFKVFIALSLLVFQPVYGQEKDAEGYTINPDQLELIKQERELLKTNRDALKSTLTAEQKNLLRDKSLTLQEKRRVLNRSFSIEQKELIKRQQLGLNRLRASFNAGLTAEQRELLKERLLRRFKNFRDRAELRFRDRPSTDGS